MESTNNKSMKEYLVESFSSQARVVLDNRLRYIDISITDLNDLINSFNHQIDNLQNDIFNYPEYLQKLSSIKELIKEVNEDYHQALEKLQKRQRDLSDKYLILSKMVGNYYDNLMLKIENRNNYLNICEYIDDIMRVLKNKVYFIAMDTPPIRRDIEQLKQSLQEEYNIKTKKEQAYVDETLNLAGIMIASLKASLNQKIEEANLRIAKLNQNKQELTNTFEDLISKYSLRVERLVNESLYNGVNREDIINQTNDLIKELVSSLETQKSYEEINRYKNKRLEELTTRLNELKPIYEESTYHQALVNEYKQKLSIVQKNIREMNNFLDKSNQIITQSPLVQMTYQKYNHYNNESIRIKNYLNELDEKQNQLIREKSNLSFSSGNEQAKLDNQQNIIDNEEERLKVNNDLKTLIKEKLDFEQSLDNVKLIEIFNKRNYLENNLPSIINKQDIIKEKLQTSINRLEEIKEEVNEYLHLQKEIEENE